MNMCAIAMRSIGKQCLLTKRRSPPVHTHTHIHIHTARMFNSYAFLENTGKRDSCDGPRTLIFLINTQVAIFIFPLVYSFLRFLCRHQSDYYSHEIVKLEFLHNYFSFPQ